MFERPSLHGVYVGLDDGDNDGAGDVDGDKLGFDDFDGETLGKAVSGHDPNTFVSDDPKLPPPEATCSLFT